MVAKVTSRAIVGKFYHALEQGVGQSWIGPISTYFKSDQESEEYAWLGSSPVMREWIGGRLAKGLTEKSITIRNKKYESTMEIPVDWLRRDKTTQIEVRIREMAARANAHWASLLTTLIIDGESNTCYDGQYFFDTDHSEGSSGSQSNDISVDISALAVGNHGSTTAPSVSEFAESIMNGVQTIVGLKDDVGEPRNELASNFLVMVPTSLWRVARSAVAAPVIDGGDTNTIPLMDGFRISVQVNPRLTWTDKFAVFRTDSDVGAFIRQEEEGLKVAAIAEDSELEFNEDVHRYGIKAIRNVGYGYWQNACLVTMA